MAIWDLFILSNGGAGDFQLNGNDLTVCKSIENAIYLSMYGGNIEADTKLPRPNGIQDFSWWGNALFLGTQQGAQFNSLTERTLNTTPLNSSGRVIIENAIKKDLSWLPNVTVNCQIVSTDRINTGIRIVLPSGVEQVGSFSFVFNPISGDFDLIDFDFIDFF